MGENAVLRVLGIDPGLTRCGIALLHGPAHRAGVVHHACVGSSTDEPLEQRLLVVHNRVLEAIETHDPDVVAVERVLFSVNVRTAMATGQAAGAALLAAARAQLPVVAYTPTDVKLSVAGSGAADKAAVGRMVAAQLGLDASPQADVADAMAVALTHLARARFAGNGGGARAENLAEAQPAAARDARRAGEAGVERRQASARPAAARSTR